VCLGLLRISWRDKALIIVRELLYWGPLGCMCIGLLDLVWGEAHPIDYIIIILLLESIEQPFYPI
jgi:hypothetical protein